MKLEVQKDTLPYTHKTAHGLWPGLSEQLKANFVVIGLGTNPCNHGIGLGERFDIEGNDDW